MSDKDNKKLRPLVAAIGATSFAVSIATSPIVNAVENPFSATNLSNGYMVAGSGKGDMKAKEGKCGEGKCGDKKAKEGKCGEGKCGDKKAKEGKCGEGKCGDKKAKEGKCGEGKCGSK